MAPSRTLPDHLSVTANTSSADSHILTGLRGVVKTSRFCERRKYRCFCTAKTLKRPLRPVKLWHLRLAPTETRRQRTTTSTTAVLFMSSTSSGAKHIEESCKKQNLYRGEPSSRFPHLATELPVKSQYFLRVTKYSRRPQNEK